MTTARESVEEWARRLEEEGYVQGNGILVTLPGFKPDDRPIVRETKRYCCLGVYCEQLVDLKTPLNAEGGVLEVHNGRIDRRAFGIPTSEGMDSSLLPVSVTGFLNDGTLSALADDAFTWNMSKHPLTDELYTQIRDAYPKSFSTGLNKHCSLVSLNDHGVPFKLIAQVIRQVWLKEVKTDGESGEPQKV